VTEDWQDLELVTSNVREMVHSLGALYSWPSAAINLPHEVQLAKITGKRKRIPPKDSLSLCTADGIVAAKQSKDSSSAAAAAAAWLL
jgi:hypothetical protein